MAAVLGTNIASLWASKNLQSAQSNMANSVERLSSGLRINRAKDDAAGLGIANSLTQQINGANQGIKNLNDGISIVQTAEGAIAAASDMAQRILTLATQGLNGSVDSSARTSIRNEIQQLLVGISDISRRTKFSSTRLLNVADGTSTTETKFSIVASAASGDNIALVNEAFMNIGGDFRTVTGAGSNTTALVISSAAKDTVAATQTVWILKAASDATVGYVDATLSAIDATGTALTLGTAQTWGATDLVVFEKGLLTKDSSTTNIRSLAEHAYSADLVAATASTAQTAFGYLSTSVTEYLTALSSQRAKLGAYQNQMEYAVSNVTEMASNLSAARSRVNDTDYASETATLTKGQILQQAATAMLAQANQMPNVILTLLK
jgi:flagellin